jgi:hypothetical protein
MLTSLLRGVPRIRRLALSMGLLAAVMTTLAGPTRALAQDDPNKLLADGILLRKHGQNEEAARLFQRAYQMTKSARAVAHLGTTEYDLQRWVDAEVHLAEALRTRNDPWIEERRQAIKQTLDWTRAKLGWLQVVGRPAGAEVEVAGKTVGQLPLREPIRLEAGEVYVRVSADGYESFRRSVLVQNEQTANVVVELERQEAPMAVGRGRDATVGSPNGVASAGDPRVGGAGTNWRWPAAWVTAGFAVLLTGTGTTFGLIHNSKVDDFDHLTVGNTTRLQCSTAATDSGGGRCPVLLAEANQARNIAIGSFIGAGAAAILATVFFATAPSTPAPDRVAAAPQFSCVPDLLTGRSGATCQYRF